MAVTTFLPRTVRRSVVYDFIGIAESRVVGANGEAVAAVVLNGGRKWSGDLRLPVQVAIVGGFPLIVPRPQSEEANVTGELVYVQVVGCPGVGRKRYPCICLAVPFSEWPGVRVLAKSYRGKGSGSDDWYLLAAPLGFAKALADYIAPRYVKDAGEIVLRPSE